MIRYRPGDTKRMPISKLNVLAGRIPAVYILTAPVETSDPGVTPVGSQEHCRSRAVS